MRRIRILLAALLLLAIGARAASLFGTVTDMYTNDPLENVELTAAPVNDAGDPIVTTYSNPEGAYLLQGLEAGANMVMATLSGYRITQQYVIVDEAGTQLDVELQPYSGQDCILNGYARDAETGALIMEPWVQLQQGRSFYGVPAAQGHFFRDDVLPGSTLLYVTAYDYMPLVMEILLEEGVNTVAPQLQYQPEPVPASLTATVVDATTQEVLRGAYVTVRQEPWFLDYAQTDTMGSVQVEGLREGGAIVITSLDEYTTGYQAAYFGGGANELEIQLLRTNAIAYGVLECTLLDYETGSPITGAAVELRQDGEILQNLVTDESGACETDTLLADRYQLQLQHPDYIPAYRSVVVGSGLSEVEFELIPRGDPGDPASLELNVVDQETGLGVQDVAVVVIADDLIVESSTDAAGFALIPNLTSGNGRLVSMQHPDFHPMIVPILLQPGTNVRTFGMQPFLVQQPASLTLHLSDGETGEAVQGAVVQLHSASGEWTRMSDESGDVFFNSPLLRSGRANVWIGLLFLDLTLEPGFNEFDVELFPFEFNYSMRLQGRIADRITRDPLTEAEICAQPVGHEADSLLMSVNANGEFLFSLPWEEHGWRMITRQDGWVTDSLFLPYMEIRALWLERLLESNSAQEQWAHLQGSVTREDGGAVIWADLEAISQNPEQPFSYFATLEEDGSYDLQAAAGSYLLSCQALVESEGEPVQLQLYYPGVSSIEDAELITIVESEIIENLDFVLPISQSISVAVAGSVRDPLGQAIEGAVVRFWTEDEELVDAQIVTDPEGIYSTTVVSDRLPIVPFSLSVEHEDYEMQFFSDAASFGAATRFLFTADGEISNADFVLMPLEMGLSIEGTVELGDDLAGSAIISAFSPDGSLARSVVADASGYFLIEGLPVESDLALLYHAPGHEPIFSGGVYSLNEAELVATDAQDQQLMSLGQSREAIGPATVAGRIHEAQRLALAGALVVVHSPESGDLRHAYANSSGWFQVDGLGADELVALYVSLPGYEGEMMPLQLNSSQQRTTLVDIELIPLEDTAIDGGAELPQDFELLPNHPNPFNPTTMIGFAVPKRTQLSVRVFDLRGALVTQLADQVFSPGTHNLVFDGNGLASGIYLLHVQGDGIDLSRRMLLLK